MTCKRCLASIGLLLPALVSSLHTSKVDLDMKADVAEAAVPPRRHGWQYSALAEQRSTSKNLARKPGLFEGPAPWPGMEPTSLFRKPPPAIQLPAPARATPKATQHATAAAPRKVPLGQKALLKAKAEQDAEGSMDSQRRAKAKEALIAALKKKKISPDWLTNFPDPFQLFGIPTPSELMYWANTVIRIPGTVHDSGKAVLNGAINATKQVKWLPELLPYLEKGVDKIMFPLKQKPTPQPKDYDVEELRIATNLKKRMYDAMLGVTASKAEGENLVDSNASNVYCSKHLEELYMEGKRQKGSLVTFVGDGAFEATTGTTCGIPLKGLCESGRTDKRGCAKAATFYKNNAGGLLPSAMPTRESAVHVTDFWLTSMPHFKPLVLASAGMTFKDALSLITRITEETHYRSSLWFLNLGMKDLLGAIDTDAVKEDFGKLAYYMQYSKEFEYSIVAFHPILPCKKCEAFGLTPAAISNFNQFMVNLLTGMNVKGPRRFIIVNCDHVFKLEVDQKNYLPDGMHPGHLGHAKWAECYSPQLNAAYAAMKKARILNYKV